MRPQLRIGFYFHYSLFLLTIIFLLNPSSSNAEVIKYGSIGNFGLPGIIDLPTGKALNEGDTIITQQVHRSLSRTGLSFQVTPKLGFSFLYGGLGPKSPNHPFDTGRLTHDRSFDAHITLINERKIIPSISIGLRDFIGTGKQSSEYIVGTKNFGSLNLTAGIGFGRLAERNSFENPFSNIRGKLKYRSADNFGLGGSIGKINWFHGNAAPFFAAVYKINPQLSFLTEYTSDKMTWESQYLDISSPWNIGLNYKLNDFINLSTQYLHGSTISITAKLIANPRSPPFGAGMELAPVPMRLKRKDTKKFISTDIAKIKNVLNYDEFKILRIKEDQKLIRIDLVNKKFRSVAQAVGRVSSTLQRFSKDEIEKALIVFHNDNLQLSSYLVDLNQVAYEQFGKEQFSKTEPSISEVKNFDIVSYSDRQSRFLWSIGPYIAHRLFNPDLPISAELGAEIEFDYHLNSKIRLDGSIRKSVVTNLTKNRRRSNSELPRVHSDWPLYDIAGQKGHIHNLTFSYSQNLSPNLYARSHFGLLEPFFAGVGGEILYKPPSSNFGFGIDVHRVQKRDYEMLLSLKDYHVTTGHLSLYYDAGGKFDLELNAGRYLAGDWGATTDLSRRFSNGWRVGAYATFTDVPFEKFGEGSFDKGIYIIIPFDWLTGKPDPSRRRFVIRPITRDGGAQLASARSLYRQVRYSKASEFYREKGRLWK